MSTHLDVQLPVRARNAAAALQQFTESPRVLLGPGARRTIDLWQVQLSVGRIKRPVAVSLGSVRRSSGSTDSGSIHWRSLRWRPERPGLEGGMIPDPRFPSFVGALGLQTEPEGALILRGSYDPPGGHLGNLVDGLFLHKAAEVTATDLLTDIRSRLVDDQADHTDQASSVRSADG